MMVLIYLKMFILLDSESILGAKDGFPAVYHGPIDMKKSMNSLSVELIICLISFLVFIF